jgi:ABC-type transport system substrate-binding protein
MVAALAASIGLGAGGCRVSRPPNDHSITQTLYDSTTSDPGTFNPILVTDNASGQAIGDLFEGLVRVNPLTMLPEPGLAQSWEFADGGRPSRSTCAMG